MRGVLSASKESDCDRQLTFLMTKDNALNNVDMTILGEAFARTPKKDPLKMSNRVSLSQENSD